MTAVPIWFWPVAKSPIFFSQARPMAPLVRRNRLARREGRRRLSHRPISIETEMRISAFARRDGQPSVVSLGDGTGHFTEMPLPDSVADTRAIAAADFNGDGAIDLALGVIGGLNVIYLNDGAGHFRRSERFGATDGRTYALAAADLDRDGDIDIVEARTGQTNQVHYNDGGAVLSSVDLGGQSADTYGVALGDMNGDGLMDAVFANAGDVNGVWLGR